MAAQRFGMRQSSLATGVFPSVGEGRSTQRASGHAEARARLVVLPVSRVLMSDEALRVLLSDCGDG